MAKDDIRRSAKNFLFLTAGSLIYAAGFSFFLDPHNIASGGVTGIAQILSSFLPLDPGLLTFLINVPLMIAAFLRFRGQYLFGTLYTLALSSFAMDRAADLFSSFVPVSTDLMLCAAAGGAFMALGGGLVSMGGGSTGGSDIIIRFLRQKYMHLKTGVLSLLIDFAVAAVSCVVFGNVEVGLYGVVTLFVYGYVLDFVLYGGNEAKLVFIISNETQKISCRLMEELGHGVTWIDAQGAYTGNDKKVIFSAFRKQNYQRVREVVKEEDPDAFLIVTSATEIFGEGFKDHFADEV